MGKLVLHTAVTGSVLYSLCVEVVLDVVRKLADDSDGVEAGDEVLDSQPSRNPRGARPTDGNEAFKSWRRAFSNDVLVVLKVQHRLAVRTALVPELAHALHHTAQHACSIELRRLSSPFQRRHVFGAGVYLCSGLSAAVHRVAHGRGAVLKDSCRRRRSSC